MSTTQIETLMLNPHNVKHELVDKGYYSRKQISSLNMGKNELSNLFFTTVNWQNYKKYLFTRDWTTSSRDPFKISAEKLFTKFLSEYIGKPAHFLEIGCFEGCCSVFMLEKFLTHKDSKLTCIDSFSPQAIENMSKTNRIYYIFLHNIKISGLSHKIHLITDQSHNALKNMKDSKYDFIYVDADHALHHPLEDCVLSFSLLKKGGYMCMDDYLLKNTTKRCIDSFLNCYEDFINILCVGYKVFIQKTKEYP